MSCKGKPSLNQADIEYVQTTVDLLRVRANVAPGKDSLLIQSSLDSVYRRRHTTAVEYQKQSAALAADPDHANAVFAAIDDSISKQ